MDALPIAALAALVALALVLSWRLRVAGTRSSSATTDHDVSVLEARLQGVKREKDLVDEVLARIGEGVIVLNDALVPVLANRAATILFGAQGEVPGRLPDGLESLARRALTENEPIEELLELRYPARSSVRVNVSRIPQGGVVIVLRDVSDEQRTLRIRRQFVSHASHELKTPVASIQALAEAVRLAMTEDPQDADRFATRLVAEADRLGRLVGDLLDLSRLEDPSTISNSVAELSDIARLVAQEQLPAATAKGQRLSLEVAEGLRVRGDGAQLGLMIRNLIDNAIRYTPDGGAIDIHLERDDAEVVLRVADDGVGIPLKDQARVFERFYRVDEGRSRDRGGTGLGLAIVKHIADLHGGHVSLASEFGEGSEFEIRLRLASV